VYAVQSIDRRPAGRWVHLADAYAYGLCLLRAGESRVAVVDADTGLVVVTVQPVPRGNEGSGHAR